MEALARDGATDFQSGASVVSTRNVNRPQISCVGSFHNLTAIQNRYVWHPTFAWQYGLSGNEFAGFLPMSMPAKIGYQVLASGTALFGAPTAANAAGLDQIMLPWPWALPFVGLLLSIAIGPLLAPKFWYAHYGKVAFMWS